MSPAREDSDTTTIAGEQGNAVLARAFSIRVVGGPDDGATVTISSADAGSTLVGSSPVCGLKLTDRLVSRRHLSVNLADGGLRIRDLDSTNGTWIGPTRVRDVELATEEELRVGETVLRFSPAIVRAAPMAAGRGFGEVLGESTAMRRLYPLLERLAQSPVSLLIEGETGTGKEVVAQAIHEAGPRREGPFVVCDCTTLSATLAESALFGHEKGSFTGAGARHIGYFEQADHGTLLLDEIGDLPVDLQAKLLRAIERGEIRRVGGDRVIRVDVRLMAATRRDLEREIEERRFRDDLFYRLAVARVELPPLRERGDDVRVLAEHFWRSFGGEGPLPPALEQQLGGSRWSGNVRELRNAIARRVALGDLEPPTERAPSELEEATDLIASVIERGLPLVESRNLVVAEFERRYLESTLHRAGGDATKAAQEAGVARRYFQLLRSRRTTER